MAERALVGEVQQRIDGRWRVVLVGERTPVRDRRRDVDAALPEVPWRRAA